MSTRPDLIAVVEACYDLSSTERVWLQAIADALFEVLRPDDGLLAYHVDLDEAGFRIRNPVQSGQPAMDMVERITSMQTLLEGQRSGELGLVDGVKAKIYTRIIRSAIREPADHLLQSEFSRVGPTWMYTLGAPIKDVFALVNHHVDDNGATGFFGGLRQRRRLRPAQRASFQMLSAHIKAGLRLRRRLAASSEAVLAPEGGAVLSPSGALLHAEGDARFADIADELRDGADRMAFARSRSSGRGDDALSIWQGLIDGRWSLVERFDVDGKRFLLAHRNPAEVRDPRGLSEMESRVVGLAVRGYSDKLIAYHLGIKEGTVSSHLTRALRKLRLANRAALIRQLGTRYPQDPM